MNYDPATTKVYDIRKLDFGNLENGLFTNTFKASFNLKNVVSTLFELRSKLKDKKISAFILDLLPMKIAKIHG